MVSRLWIDSQWIEGQEPRVQTYDPYRGDIVGEVEQASRDQVNLAVLAAKNAKAVVAALPQNRRKEILLRAAELTGAHEDELATLITREIGKPIKFTRDEVRRAVDTFTDAAEECGRVQGELLNPARVSKGQGYFATTLRFPIGIVAAITPFNAPLNLMVHKVAPALASGNPIIVKPAPQTPHIATRLVELMQEAGWPEGGIQLLHGGTDIGRALVSHPDISMVTFTGGLKAGQEVAQLAGLRKQILELGGNAATIVEPDANLEAAARLVVRTGFSNSGQSCISVQRVFVHESVYDRFQALVQHETRALTVGDPLDPQVDVGTVVDRPTAARIAVWIDEAKALGAHVVAGGTRRGAVVEPTVLAHPPFEARVMHEEVFGPVVSLVSYADFAAALALANDTAFGLQAGVFTSNLHRAFQAVNTLQVGGVVINGTSNFRLDHLPYGGIQMSGKGREGARYAMREMTVERMVLINLQEIGWNAQ
ncbi:MAG: aldehyde dehydrogenase family protein [Sulfobacillus sp.]